MADDRSGNLSARGPRNTRRTGIPLGPEATAPPPPAPAGDQDLPVRVTPPLPGTAASDWARANRSSIEHHLTHAGAVLLRGFGTPGGARELEAVMAALYSTLVSEHERSSPRHQVTGSVYTSTDHPADQEIFLHNEMSYSHTWPMRIGFYCHVPPASGGWTPIADTRQVLKLIPPEVRTRFADKGVMYVRNYSRGLGLTWEESFQTDDRTAVEEYCRQSGLVPEWKEGNGLRTRRVGSAFARHPATGEMIWFNHATFFHVSTLEPLLRDALLADMAPEDVPTNSFYGDGSAIEDDVLAILRDAYRRPSTWFPWQSGDILLIDNMLTAHGRAPFTGSRQVLVAMAEPVRGLHGP